MASELRVTTIANNAGTESVNTTYVVNGSAKAWFSAVTWATADNSLNVSSISDDSAGQSTVSLSNAFADDDYTVAGLSTDADGVVKFHTSRTAGSWHVRHYGGLAGSAAYVDSELTVNFHGDLA